MRGCGPWREPWHALRTVHWAASCMSTRCFTLLLLHSASLPPCNSERVPGARLHLACPGYKHDHPHALVDIRMRFLTSTHALRPPRSVLVATGGPCWRTDADRVASLAGPLTEEHPQCGSGRAFTYSATYVWCPRGLALLSQPCRFLVS